MMGFFEQLRGGMHGNGKIEPEHLDLLDAVALVATYLPSTYIPKTHGGYKVYEDELVRISLDTYVPITSVQIKMESGLVLVFSCDYDGHAYVYRPGKWEQYIQEALRPEAELAHQKSQRQWSKKESDKLEACFSPIDDEAVFAD